MRRITILLICVFSAGFLGAEESQSGTTFLTSADDLPDLMIRPYAYPKNFTGPDIQQCTLDGEFARCEQMLLATLPGASANPEAAMFLYGTLGMMAYFQSDQASDSGQKATHSARAIDYYDKAITLARVNKTKYKLHLASFLSDQASLLEVDGDLAGAIVKHRELSDFLGVGSGNKTDLLAASSVTKTAALRLEAGEDTAAVAATLDGLKDHANEEIAFAAKQQLLKMDLMKKDATSVRKKLDELKRHFAGRDSLGATDLNQWFRSVERHLTLMEE